MTTPAPIIPWMGGKRRLADRLLPQFPPHTCYVEVFAGGAALYFLRPPAEVEVINDINGDLVNLYRVVKIISKNLCGSLNMLCRAARFSNGRKTRRRKR